jgi:RNA polymerase sigma-70 factor (ECF subfamily)
VPGNNEGVTDATIADALEAAHREHWGRLLALLTKSIRSLDIAEESLADAFTVALEHWRTDGIPDRPEAWLLTVARRRATDRLRRDATLTRKLPLLVTDAQEAGPDDDDTAIPDERLRLLFTCCHPALAMEARVALTLRMIGGLTTPEVARAFLVTESTMAARITRAKKKIAAAGIPYRVPSDTGLPERLAGVLSVLYLIFTEGYAASSGAGPVRRELADEAIRLTRIVAALMPNEPEPTALVALMLLQHSRRETRVDQSGQLVLLAEQDRTRWDAANIAEGLRLLDRAISGGRGGMYALQAAIAAEHARAAKAQETDWGTIVALYRALEDRTGSPVIRLNRAVAVAELDGPEAGLALLDGLDEQLPRYHLLPACRADMLRRLGRNPEAVAAYDQALALAGTDADRELLTRRRDSCRTERVSER